MRLQLWSWNYDPEPTAMGPIATAWARGMRDRGHEVEVITAHPHYPPGIWGRRARPYREVRDGIPVTRLPLVSGSRSGVARAVEELTYGASALVAAAMAKRVDAVVAVSPSFLGLGAVMAHTRARRIPWLLWLQDILPDAASTTGFVRSGAILRSARAFEAAAYRSADRIVVIGDTFGENLVAKGVPEGKLARIYNPATRGIVNPVDGVPRKDANIVYLGNVGHSQGLADFVAAFCARDAGAVRLVVIGTGDQLAAVQAVAASSDAVAVLGFVPEDRLEQELRRASIALISQRPDVDEFNVPSRLMTLMGRGIPVLASVRAASEVARIVKESGGGWVADGADPSAAVELAHTLMSDPEELARRGSAAAAFAQRSFDLPGFLDRFEAVLATL